jgi:hypothetical protein
MVYVGNYTKIPNVILLIHSIVKSLAFMPINGKLKSSKSQLRYLNMDKNIKENIENGLISIAECGIYFIKDVFL